MAATPDRVCYDATETIPWGIIEVKCPFNARDMTPAEAAKKIKTFMNTLQEDGTLEKSLMNTITRSRVKWP